MPANTGSREWQAAVARLIAEDGPDGLSDALIRVIDQVVDHSRVAMLAFGHDAPPVVLAHDLAPAEEKHYLQRYIAGREPLEIGMPAPNRLVEITAPEKRVGVQIGDEEPVM